MRKIFFCLITLLSAIILLLAFSTSIPRNMMFWGIEGIAVIMLVFLLMLHRRVMRPMQTIASGMELLREQDFSSRLRNVGEPEADRIVDIFNRMMTELKEGRLRLQERNQLLNKLIEVSPMGVVMLDFDGHISSVNPAARHILEYTDDYEGHGLKDINNDLARKISTLGDEQSETFKMSDAHIYRCTRMSFIDRGFKHPFILIESLTQDVMKAEREAYGKVIRMISHEVNNTMASVSSIMDTVENEMKNISDTDELRKALQACSARSLTMSAFIKRFADVVKIPEPVLQQIPLNSVITANRQFLESLCNVHGIKATISLCDDSPIINADAALMTQVMINIVKNSIESIMERGNTDGGIILETCCSPAMITVTDNGIGISKKTEKELFTPFFSTKPNGHGIGLLLIREILTRHNSHFSLKTNNDRMTTFRIEFQVSNSQIKQ